MWEMLAGIAIGLLLVWGLLIAMIWRLKPDELTLKGALRLLPDLLRMLKGIATDATVPRGVRVRLWLLLAYLAVPIDLIPDFIPIIGYADDAVIIVAALRSVVRHAGTEVVTRHWPGSPEGLAAVFKLANLDDTSRPSGRPGV
ncbi:YkvA family protein [Monashia sp. NPDC004114]